MGVSLKKVYSLQSRCWMDRAGGCEVTWKYRS